MQLLEKEETHIIPTMALVFVVVVLFFQDEVFLYNPGHPGTCSVDQAGLEIHLPPLLGETLIFLMATQSHECAEKTVKSSLSSPDS